MSNRKVFMNSDFYFKVIYSLNIQIVVAQLFKLKERGE